MTPPMYHNPARSHLARRPLEPGPSALDLDSQWVSPELGARRSCFSSNVRQTEGARATLAAREISRFLFS